MKKLTIALCALAISASLTGADAQTLAGKKIYINPGHGGYEAVATTPVAGTFANGYRSDGSNATDRWNATVPYPSVCEEGCWESKHNLWRGLELQRLLEKAGATVKMSRTQNRPEDDRILTEIGAEATAWGADMFVSIHTNGNGANHVMTMFRGADPRPGQPFDINDPDIPASKEMAIVAWKHLHDNNLTCWQALKDESQVRAVADSAFYATWTSPYHLGVFRQLWVPGFLAECSFHDYKPEAHRLLNPDYSNIVAYSLYTAICDYFNAPQPATGNIVGAVKDAKRIFRDPLFLGATFGDHDQYLPINDAKVTLTGNGVNKVYVTDKLYNGIFDFPDLAPGTYHLLVEADGYTSYEGDVVCEAAKNRGPIVMLDDPSYDPTQTIRPNVFASALEAVGSNAIRFTLNGDAKNVAVNLLNGDDIVKTIDLGPRSKGTSTVELDGVEGGDGEYAWSLTVSNDPVGDEPGQVSENGDPLLDIANARGVSIDNNPASDFFGRIYVTSIEANGKKGNRMGTGVYILDAALSDITGQGGTPYQGGEAWKGNSSPYRPSVAPDGSVYVCDWSDGHSGVWVMNPAEPGAAWRPVFGGTRNADGLASEGDVKIHGSIAGVFVTGTGESTQMFTCDEDYDADGKTHVLRYDLGTSTSPWVAAPSHEYDLQGGLLANGNQSLASDGRGGVWVCQYRYSADAYPCLSHINGKTGEFDFNTVGSKVFNGSGPIGALGVSPDGRYIAVPNTSQITIAEATYDADGTPTLEYKWTIGSTYGSRPFDCDFDVAGNLYVAFNDNGGGIGIWSLPKEDNSYTTKSNDKIRINSGINGVTTTDRTISIANGIVSAGGQIVTVYNAMGTQVGCGTQVSLQGKHGVFIARTQTETLKIAR